jgi:prepilin-type N-terminal cleavage/methylation domain-containing protein
MDATKGEVNILKRLLSNERGFSLIELLICLAIIALLAAIALPMLRGVLQSAKEAAFDEQVRALSLAAECYLMDGGGDTIWAPGAGAEAWRGEMESHDAWGEYLEKWPENPLGGAEFTVVIEGGEVSISPGRDR